MKAPIVSVIIPCFNTREFVSEAIDSAYSQEISGDIEVIVVDDGSTDGTWEELLRIRMDRHASLQILSHPGRINLGTSASRYRGLLASSGVYVAFLDADDIFLPNKLAIQLRAMKHHPSVVMSHAGVRVIGDLSQAEFFQAVFSLHPKEPYQFRQRNDYLIRNGICSSSAVVRAEVLKTVRFAMPQLFQYEDWLCWCLLASKGDFLFQDVPLVAYRVHGHSATSGLKKNRLRQLHALLEMKLALFVRSESSLHAFRVLLSLLESLRLLLVEYMWDPVLRTSDPTAKALPRHALLQVVLASAKVLSLPHRLRRRPP